MLVDRNPKEIITLKLRDIYNLSLPAFFNVGCYCLCCPGDWLTPLLLPPMPDQNFLHLLWTELPINSPLATLAVIQPAPQRAHAYLWLQPLSWVPVFSFLLPPRGITTWTDTKDFWVALPNNSVSHSTLSLPKPQQSKGSHTDKCLLLHLPPWNEWLHLHRPTELTGNLSSEYACPSSLMQTISWALQSWPFLPLRIIVTDARTSLLLPLVQSDSHTLSPKTPACLIPPKAILWVLATVTFPTLLLILHHMSLF